MSMSALNWSYNVENLLKLAQHMDIENLLVKCHGSDTITKVSTLKDNIKPHKDDEPYYTIPMNGWNLNLKEDVKCWTIVY